MTESGEQHRFINFFTEHKCPGQSCLQCQHRLLFDGWVYHIRHNLISIVYVHVRRRGLITTSRIILFSFQHILVGNFGQEWEVGSVETVKTPYRAGSRYEINASIALKLGLRSMNITLKGRCVIDLKRFNFWARSLWNISVQERANEAQILKTRLSITTKDSNGLGIKGESDSALTVIMHK